MKQDKKTNDDIKLRQQNQPNHTIWLTNIMHGHNW